MKKLLFFLIPLFAFGQTYEELNSIYDFQDFVKVMLENEYETIGRDSEKSEYAWGIEKDYIGNVAYYRKADYFIEDNTIVLYLKKGDFKNKSIYDKIYSNIKNKCEFISVDVKTGIDWLDYKCDRKFKISSLDGWYLISINNID